MLVKTEGFNRFGFNKLGLFYAQLKRRILLAQQILQGFESALHRKEIKIFITKPAIGVEPITFGLQNRYSAN